MTPKLVAAESVIGEQRIFSNGQIIVLVVERARAVAGPLDPGVRRHFARTSFTCSSHPTARA